MDYLETIRLAIISEPSNALIFLYHKLKISNTRILKSMMWCKTIILTNPEGDTSAQRSLAIAVYLEQHLTINSPSREEKISFSRLLLGIIRDFKIQQRGRRQI